MKLASTSVSRLAAQMLQLVRSESSKVRMTANRLAKNLIKTSNNSEKFNNKLDFCKIRANTKLMIKPLMVEDTPICFKQWRNKDAFS